MRKLIIALLVVMVGMFLLTPPAIVYADSEDPGDGCVNTIILGGENHKVCDTDGSSLFALLNLVVQIMTIGVGILGVIGISVTGVQYLTAGGNEEKTRKAKRRMFEIIIGLAVYATFFMLAQWFINNFEIREGNWDGSSASEGTSSGT